MSESNYASAGVSYELLDAAKKLAAAQALATTGLLQARGGTGVDASRGEPAFVFELGDRSLAIVLECLGTKSVIARQYLQAGGADRFADIGYDAVAAIVNDLCCVGALPLVVNAYFATGSSQWQADPSGRYGSLVTGWRRACEAAGAVWGGGETPSLSGIIDPEEIDLAGAAVGEVPPGHRPILGQDLAPGDEIVLVASSGLHANGASLARTVAAELPDGYRTRLPSGREFGAALLDPTRHLRSAGRGAAEAESPGDLSQSHHRARDPQGDAGPARADLRIHTLPPVPEVLEFLAKRARLGPHEAWGVFNMGSGFAVFCGSGSGPEVIRAAEDVGLTAVLAGVVEHGPRRLIVEPLGVTYQGDELQLS